MPDCRTCVQAAELDECAEPLSVKAHRIDGALFQARWKSVKHGGAQRYLNGKLFGQGRMSCEELLAKLEHQPPTADEG